MTVITFDDILNGIRKAFQQEPLLSLSNQFTEATIIRDVQGKIRFYFHLEERFLSTEDKESINEVMNRRLGSYYTGDIWEGTDKKIADSGLIELIKSERVPFEGMSSESNWFLVERHSSKHMWTLQSTGKPPWDVSLVDQGHKPAIVSFFSFKGGTGRTTTLVGTALKLAQKGKRVLIIDLDLEAPGLASIFFKESEMKAGVVDYLIEKAVQDHWSVRQHILPISDKLLIGNDGEILKLIPAGTVDGNFIQKLARLDFQNLTTNSVGDKLKEMLLEINRTEMNLDFILIDARAGFHDIGGFALGDLSHAAVIAGQHTKQTWAGLTHVINRLGKPNVVGGEPLPSVLIHTMAPEETSADTTILKEFREKAYDVFQENYYSNDDLLPNSNDEEAPFYPIVIPWNNHLHGDVSLFYNSVDDKATGEKKVEAFVRELTGTPYVNVADKLCRLFGKRLDGGDTGE